MSKPLIYIAGPYSRPDPVVNTRKAVIAAERIEQQYLCDVFIPHLTLLWHLVSPAPIGKWYDRDNAILRRCDALIRLPGQSHGADGEMRLAYELGLPVFEGTKGEARFGLWRADFSD